MNLIDPISAHSVNNRSVHLPYEQRESMHHKIIADLVDKHTPSGNVLDIGCGTGIVLQYLRERRTDLQLSGADIDITCLQSARRRIPDLTSYQITSQEYSSSIPLNHFDTCIMCHVLEHTRFPLASISESMKLLKSGGKLILATPNPHVPQQVILSMCRVHYVNRGHVHSWDRSTWYNFLENIAHLDIVEHAIDEVRIFPYKWKQKFSLLLKFELSLGRLFPWWTYSNISVVKKP